MKKQKTVRDYQIKKADFAPWKLDPIAFREKCGDFKLGFGVYKGEPIRDIPLNYLMWLLLGADGLPPVYRKLIECWLGLLIPVGTDSTLTPTPINDAMQYRYRPFELSEEMAQMVDSINSPPPIVRSEEAEVD